MALRRSTTRSPYFTLSSSTVRFVVRISSVPFFSSKSTSSANGTRCSPYLTYSPSVPISSIHTIRFFNILSIRLFKSVASYMFVMRLQLSIIIGGIILVQMIVLPRPRCPIHHRPRPWLLVSQLTISSYSGNHCCAPMKNLSPFCKLTFASDIWIYTLSGLSRKPKSFKRSAACLKSIIAIIYHFSWLSYLESELSFNVTPASILLLIEPLNWLEVGIGYKPRHPLLIQ